MQREREGGTPFTPASRTAAQHLVDTLRKRGIKDPLVLKAIGDVPRDLFVPDAFRHRAYEDEALPIDCSQTISQPYTVAHMTEQLQLEPGMKVLEIGTGSGYQAAILCAMGVRVYTIERHADLMQTARRRLESIGCTAAFRVGDGSLGWSEFAPYDAIIVTAGAPRVPGALLRQLAPDGRLAIPIGDRNEQRLHLVVRVEDTDEFETYDLGGVRFVPLVGRNAWEEGGLDRS